MAVNPMTVATFLQPSDFPVRAEGFGVVTSGGRPVCSAFTEKRAQRLAAAVNNEVGPVRIEEED